LFDKVLAGKPGKLSVAVVGFLSFDFPNPDTAGGAVSGLVQELRLNSWDPTNNSRLTGGHFVFGTLQGWKPLERKFMHWQGDRVSLEILCGLNEKTAVSGLRVETPSVRSGFERAGKS
jgi:hypothetical protein